MVRMPGAAGRALRKAGPLWPSRSHCTLSKAVSGGRLERDRAFANRSTFFLSVQGGCVRFRGSPRKNEALLENRNARLCRGLRARRSPLSQFGELIVVAGDERRFAEQLLCRREAKVSGRGFGSCRVPKVGAPFSPKICIRGDRGPRVGAVGPPCILGPLTESEQTLQRRPVAGDKEADTRSGQRADAHSPRVRGLGTAAGVRIRPGARSPRTAWLNSRRETGAQTPRRAERRFSYHPLRSGSTLVGRPPPGASEGRIASPSGLLPGHSGPRFPSWANPPGGHGPVGGAPAREGERIHPESWDSGPDPPRSWGHFLGGPGSLRPGKGMLLRGTAGAAEGAGRQLHLGRFRTSAPESSARTAPIFPRPGAESLHRRRSSRAHRHDAGQWSPGGRRESAPPPARSRPPPARRLESGPRRLSGDPCDRPVPA
ncbi:collagen alpha-1(I) chain-like [Sorex fumeus]|uniref:collagen alpha-1(I) chain-like n=1 Tax=Sorex fumeus TaxID=62283 RepID=UPI0024ACF124|nr:collagen alpha-1(I) chain-like [Sorex fumeus]